MVNHTGSLLTWLTSIMYFGWHFLSTASHFWVTGHFETTAPNGPQMTLSTKRSKVPHTHFTTIPSPKFHSASPVVHSTISSFEDFGKLLYFHWKQNFKISIGNFCEDYHREHLEKVWLKNNHNCRRSSVLKFSLPQAQMLMKISFFFLN